MIKLIDRTALLAEYITAVAVMTLFVVVSANAMGVSL
jgi:hypothetical protein